MKTLCISFLSLLVVALQAAQVGPAGYVNDFATQPSGADWATTSQAGSANDAYEVDTEVNANITAGGVTAQTMSVAADPPAAGALAAWSSTGSYLQLRPTGVRYTVLMGTFVNNTGTNATQISISYLFTLAGNGVAEEANRGTRAYFSLTGAVSSWMNVPALNSTESAGASAMRRADLAVNWPQGATLYVLWLDDNALGNPTDSANQIDSFSLTVTAGAPVSTALRAVLLSPADAAVFVSGEAVVAEAEVSLGTAPYEVEFFVSADGGAFESVGSVSTSPYQMILGLLAGTYDIYAVATDSAATPASTNTMTHTLFVADPIDVALVGPAPDASFDNVTGVSGMATVAGGTAPYSVQFYLDDQPAGAPVTAAPFDHDFGPLFVGDHLIRATVTDARGWESNSVIHTVHISGPLGIAVTPADATVLNFGEPVVLEGAPGGGTSPYTVRLYTNGVLVAELTAAPFVADLGLLPVGAYTAYAEVTDSASSIPSTSTTNLITIAPNPLQVTLTGPANGSSAQPGQAITISATASVAPPVSVANVQFFLDGFSVGIDSTPPYSAAAPNAVEGNHRVHAVATDSLGRTVRSATNQVTVAASGPPPNDQFVNAIALVGPIVTATGRNTDATKQFGGGGEPFQTAGNFGGASVWWTWTATASGLTTIDTEGSNFDTLLGVYTGAAQNQLTPVTSNNDYEANQWSRVEFEAVAGTVYRIVVDGVSPGGFPLQPAMGNIVLHVKGVGGLFLDSPTNGMVLNFGDPISVTASINEDFPNPPAARVDFYVGGNLFGTSVVAPFSAVATNVPAGSNTFYAVAIDNAGMSVQSPSVHVLVQKLGVTLLTPLDGTTYQDTSPIAAAAWTYLPSGTITNVEFLVDGVRFDEVQSEPLTGVWTNVSGGSHRLTAVAWSDVGASYSSQPVYIGVAFPLVPFGADWRYLDDGSDQGTNWIAPDFDDNSWASGPAELGYGDGDEATVIASGPEGSFYITTYFRHEFVVDSLAAISGLILSLERDDGGVVYLNGKQVFRTSNIPQVYDYLTATTGGAVEDATDTVMLNPADLVEGRNVLAVEIHQQAANSSDVSFNLRLIGVPEIERNQFPLASITSPSNEAFFVAPPSIAIEAEASDLDGTVTTVQLLADGVRVDEAAEAPYNFVWTNPPVGAHRLTVVARDDQGGVTISEPVLVIVYDALGTPVAQFENPLDGAVMEGPTNLTLLATAHAIDGITNVQFRVNGMEVGNATTGPYQVVWPSVFGSNELVAIATDANGVQGTSPTVGILITIPPTNTIPPSVANQVPLGSSTLSNLTSITVTFSERVQNVDAGDLLLNGIGATNVMGSGSNYIFRFPQPAYGQVGVTWAAGHGITDFGFPSNLPFDELSPSAQWEYSLFDPFPPLLVDHTPASGVTVTNLAEVSVSFSEGVIGLDAVDLLLNGVPAYLVIGDGTNFVFSVSQPPSGPVNVTWAGGHGITDLSSMANPFDGAAPSAGWSFVLDSRSVLVESNAVWRFVKGTEEASTPIDAWRQLGFDASSWSNAAAPFYFGADPYGSGENPGTILADMLGNYSSVYLRYEFSLANRSAVRTLNLNAVSDDGFIAWINGVEVLRYNVPEGEQPYTGTAASSAPEPSGRGAAYVLYNLTNGLPHLVNGTNVLAIHAFNQFLGSSTDFAINAQLFAFTSSAGFTAPAVVQEFPAQGDITALTNITVVFSEEVVGVDAQDLLINGDPATEVSSTDNMTFEFTLVQPPFGPVEVTWLAEHGIVDMDDPPKPFNGNLPSAIFHYTLINPSNPRIASHDPVADAVLTNLTTVTVTFTEPVMGVDPEDLLVRQAAAVSVETTDNITYVFSFPQPPFGPISVRWATNHEIRDLEQPANLFDPTRFGGQWNYTLIDPVPTVNLTAPVNGAFILAPADVTLRAVASDNDGTIERVEFFEGTTKLGESTNSPYFLILSNVSAGVYTYQASATDNIGLSVTSAPVVVNLVTSLPIALLRGPYLQIGTPSSGLVLWRTDLDSDGVVFYGQDPDSLTNLAVQSTVGREHVVEIGGLQPEMRYYYSIGSSGQRLVGGSNYWFITSPIPGTKKPVRFWVLGDSGTANNNARAVRDAYYGFAATNGPADIWLMLGDNAYNTGTDAEHQAAVFDMYPSTLRNYFLWPTLGNHETGQSTTLETFPYLDIFTLPTQGEAGGVPSGTEKYYSFDYANVHFVCLDSMTSGRSGTTPMAEWLREDLNSTAQQWIIVFFHHPPYTKGSHNSDAESDLIQIRGELVPIMEEHGVDLVLSGHSHAFERSFLINGHYGLSTTLTTEMKIDGGDGREAGDGPYQKNQEGRGVVYTVAGSSGQIGGGTLNHPAHFMSITELGSLVIDVDAGRLDMIFLASDGRTRDHLTLLKSESVVPAAPLNLIASALNAAEISLSWGDASTDETGFIVERALDGTNFVDWITTEADEATALDAGLTANTTYYYRVRAVNESGRSAPSNIASSTTVIPAGLPEAPTELVASSDNGLDHYRSRMLLRWRDRSSTESGFVIERSNDGVAFEQIGTVGANITRYADTGLQSATLYYYRVRSFNGAGSSAPSNLGVDETSPRSEVLLVGATAVFHAGVEGFAPVHYQWRFGGVAIFGATNESLVLEFVTPSDEGNYTVEVTDATGQQLSNPAYLFVISAPIILVDPVSRTNTVGSSATFIVEAIGDQPIRYRWRQNGVPIAGADQPTLTLANVQLTDQGSYDVIVENGFGSKPSLPALLTVNTPPFATDDLVYRFPNEGVIIEIVDLLANDGDVDGDPILLSSLSPASQGGTVQLTGRYVSYSPPAIFFDPDSFIYGISDGRGGLAFAVVTVEVSSNTPPAMAPLPDVLASVLTPIVLTNIAFDADVPANTLEHALVDGAGGQGLIHPRSGLLIWTPTREQAGTTNLIKLRVTDDGKPALSDDQTLAIIVRDYVEVTAGSTVVREGDNSSLPLDFVASAGVTELQLVLHYPQTRLDELTLEMLAPAVTGYSMEAAGPDAIRIICTASPSEPLQGAQQLARIHFTAPMGQASGFAPVAFAEVSVTRASAGLMPSSLVNDGRVAVVGQAALLEARQDTDGSRELIVYGEPGAQYTIESSSNPGDASSWVTWRAVTLTGMSQFELIPETAPPFIVYRARR